MATTVIICELATSRKQLPTAVLSKCADCGCDVWVAPTSVRRCEQDKSIVLECKSCAKKKITPNTKFMVPLDSVAEARAELRRRRDSN